MHTRESALVQTRKRWVGQHRTGLKSGRHRRPPSEASSVGAIGVLVAAATFVAVTAWSVAIPPDAPTSPSPVVMPAVSGGAAGTSTPETTRGPPAPTGRPEPPATATQPAATSTAPPTGMYAARDAVTEARKCSDRAPARSSSTSPSASPNEGVSPS